MDLFLIKKPLRIISQAIIKQRLKDSEEVDNFTTVTIQNLMLVYNKSDVTTLEAILPLLNAIVVDSAVPTSTDDLSGSLFKAAE